MSFDINLHHAKSNAAMAIVAMGDIDFCRKFFKEQELEALRSAESYLSKALQELAAFRATIYKNTAKQEDAA